MTDWLLNDTIAVVLDYMLYQQQLYCVVLDQQSLYVYDPEMGLWSQEDLPARAFGSCQDEHGRLVVWGRSCTSRVYCRNGRNDWQTQTIVLDESPVSGLSVSNVSKEDRVQYTYVSRSRWFTCYEDDDNKQHMKCQLYDTVTRRAIRLPPLVTMMGPRMVRPSDPIMRRPWTCVVGGTIHVGGLFGGLTVYVLSKEQQRWQAMKSRMLWAAYSAAAVCLDDTAGTIMVTGGLRPAAPNVWQARRACQIYNPQLRRWVQAADMQAHRYGHAAIRVEGRVFVIGQGDKHQLITAEQYDMSSDKWTLLEWLPESLRFSGATDRALASVECHALAY